MGWFPAAAVVAIAALAQAKAVRHPHYLHALSDLRYARFLLTRPAGQKSPPEQKEAAYRVSRALSELKRAAIDDHQIASAHPSPDPAWDRAARLLKATELLESALRDLNWDEDDSDAPDWRAHAIQDVHDALELTRKALR